jgi:hypothetical protein
MEFPSHLLLTSTNYFSWKSHMEDLLRSKGLYRITLGKEEEPIVDEKKVKWDDKNDEAHRLIIISISPDLRFHLQGIDGPNKAWEKIEAMFGKHNIIRFHQSENQLITLSPNDFPCIEDYLSKFKTLRILCIECKLDLKEDQCIYAILAKLGSAYFVFLSTFYATREDLGSAYKEHSLNYFCDALILEKYKLVQLGLINIAGTYNKALAAQQKDKSTNPKKKYPRHNDKKNKGPKPSQPNSVHNSDKGEKSKSKKTDSHCNFCGWMVMWSLNVLKRWKPYKQQQRNILRNTL